MQESTVYQHILATGEARGEARGAARGTARGERKLLVRRATRRLGSPPPGTLARREAIDDVAELNSRARSRAARVLAENGGMDA